MTLVFYIINGIRLNTQDFFITQLAASRIDLFVLKFYAPWVMRPIKLHSTVDYQPSARNHLFFCLRLICPLKPSTPSLPRSLYIFTMLNTKASRNQWRGFLFPMLQLPLILWLAI